MEARWRAQTGRTGWRQTRGTLQGMVALDGGHDDGGYVPEPQTEPAEVLIPALLPQAQSNLLVSVPR